MRCDGHAISPPPKEQRKPQTCHAHQRGEEAKIIKVNQKLTKFPREVRAEFNLSIAKRKIQMTIDTGAALTLISESVIIPGTELNTEKAVNLIGINGETNRLKSLGTVKATFYINKYGLEHEFQVVDKSVNFNADGLLGYDFMKKFQAKLDLKENVMELSSEMEEEKHEETYVEKYEAKHEEKQEKKENQNYEIFTGFTLEDAMRNMVENEYVNIFKNGEKEIQQETIYEVTLNEEQTQATGNEERKTKKVKNPDYYVKKENETENITSLISIANKTTKGNNEVEENILIYPHSMKIMSIRLENGIKICKAKARDPEMIIPEGILKAKENKANIAIINNSDKVKRITQKDIQIEYEDLRNYDAYYAEEWENNDKEYRIKYLKENIKTGNCSQETERAVHRLLEEYHDVFHIEGDRNTHTEITHHHIPLKMGTKPIFTPQYRIPQAHKEIIDQHIDKLIEDDVVEESTSRWNSPILLVPKKENAKGEKQYRMVVDFRKLNEVTETETYPMPDLEEEIARMNGTEFFSTLDLNSAFHQIPMATEDRELTSFQTTTRKLQFKRMPFGLKGSPITWQRTINMVLAGILCLMAYMDDIIAYSKTIKHHIKLLANILARLRKHGLKLRVDKSTFFCDKVEYLGHIITRKGTTANPKKVECIEQFPTPRQVVEVQRFLGMCNYYRKYVQDYSKTARPLFVLCKKDTPFVWNGACKQAFDSLKKALTTAPVLIFPDFKETFYVTTDASEYAVGSILSQGAIPDDRPIQYFSKTLTAAQINYAVIHKEMLAIILSLEQFRHYLFGREFVVITDHKPLTSLFKQTNPGQRLIRWKILLSEHDFKIIHKPGKQNQVADCLSRIKHNPEQPPETDSKPRTIEEWIKETRDEKIMQIVTRSKAQNKKILDETNQNAENNQVPQIENTYMIDEKPGTLITGNEFEHIFYLFTDSDCEMKRKLEDKTKTKIRKMPETGELLMLNNERSIAIIPKNINGPGEREITKAIITIIREFTLRRCYETIAVNINFRSNKNYTIFKEIFREVFKGQVIRTTLYLNRVVEDLSPMEIKEILETYHTSILGGHTGFGRMKNNIRRFYKWPTMNKDIKQYIRECPTCERNKIKQHTRMPMQITTVANEAFEKVYIDFIGPIKPPSPEGHKYIFTCSCDLTKFAVAVPTFDCTAATAARVLVKNIFMLFNIPKIVVSDNGPAFTADLFKETAKLLRIKHNLIAPYHPQSNAVERYHRTLGEYLRAYTEKEPTNWHEYLCYATFSYNNTVNSTTKFSPHLLVFGFEIKLPTSVTHGKLSYNYDTYKRELQLQLRNTQNMAKEAIVKSKESNKRFYDQRQKPIKLNKNDLVLLFNENKEHKYGMLYLGPYRVVEPISETVTKIKKQNRIIKVHNNKLILANANYGGGEPPPLI